MVKNNLKIAIRQIRRSSFYSTISVSGLAIAMAFCLFMAIYLRDEWTFDNWHFEPHRIYRVVFEAYDKGGKSSTSPLPVGPALKADIPEIAAMTRLTKGQDVLVRYENNKYFEKLAFIDSGYTQVFNINMVAGDPKTALSQPFQLIISEKYAKKYFGTTDPIGKTLSLGSTGKLNSIVAGVFRDFPDNTSFGFDLALPFATYEKVYGPTNLWRQMPNNSTFIRLADQASAGQVNSKLPMIAEKYVGTDIPAWKDDYKMILQPLQDIHLHSEYSSKSEKGDLRLLYLFASIAILVLTVAGINYVNYTTARFTQRAKEVGVRKVLGASRTGLVYQFLTETFLVSFLAGFVAIGIAHVLLPAFNEISGKNILSISLSQPFSFAFLSSMVLLVGFGAGIFPALFLSRSRPAETLKGKLSNLSLKGFSRNGLVIGQFTVSVIMIAITITIWRQMDFVRKSIRPETQSQVAVIQLNGNLLKQYEVLKQKILSLPGIQQVSAGSNVATFNGDGWPVMLDINSPTVQMENYAVEDDFIETLGYELLAGRSLSKKLVSDVEHGFVVNETATKQLGFALPQQAIGQSILWGGDVKKQGIIQGVVKDFYFKNLHDRIEPAVIQFAPYQWMTSDFLIVRCDPIQAYGLSEGLQSVVSSLDPTWYADVRYLDDNFMTLHQMDIQQGRLFGAFGILAILISALGLFGLAAFTAMQRTKELGIRKVLGASVFNLTTLISKDFLRLVLIANGFAFPIAYYFMDKWLENFAYRVTISWWIFMVAGLGALLIAFLTVSFQAIKAAIANPIKSLRTE